ncbi:hypothetical protein, conserved [Leishmania donovani]|uniref:Starter acyltransferase (SAT) domain-containing protein n=1 Tax=Leishmania donovani TaxID=5661 RepID=E9BAU0_LEIDO|nr:hypothetical protein, conserved [Leishmania donovani]CBZ32365.1 hypothetical protein, conserved [Leishmania donovani]
MSSRSDAPGPLPSASQSGSPLAPTASAPSRQRRVTHSHFPSAHGLAGAADAAASGTLQPLCTAVFSPEGHAIMTPFLSAESVVQAVVTPESDPAPTTAATTDEDCHAPHMAVTPAVLASASGASPATDEGVVVTTLTSLESATMPSSASPQSSTKTRAWLANQRRPRPMPYPSSIAVSSGYLLRLGHGTDSTIVPSRDTAEVLKQPQTPPPPPPPLVPLPASSTNATASAVPAFLHLLSPTTSPTATATVLSSSTMVHTPSSITATAARGRGRSNAAAARSSPDAPYISAPFATDTADDDSGVPVALGISPADGLHSTAALAVSSPNSHHTTRMGSTSEANLPYSARSGCAGIDVGRNADSHDWSTSMVSHGELMPPTAHVSLTSIAAAAAGGPSAHTTSDCTACARVGTMPTATEVVSAPRDYMGCLPSPPLSASRGPQPRQQQALYDYGSGSSGSGANNISRGAFGASWPRGGSGVLRRARADIGDSHVLRVAGALQRSGVSQELTPNVPMEESDGQIPPAAHGRQPWSALQCGLMAVSDGGTITGGAAVEAQRGASSSGGDAGAEAALAAGAAARAYEVDPIAFVLSGTQRGRSGEGGARPTSTATSRPVSLSRGGCHSSPAAQREAFRGRADDPAAATNELSPLPGYCKSARVVLSAAYAAANRGVSEASKGWDESGCVGSALMPWAPPTGDEALRNPYQAFRMHRYHTGTETQPSQHGVMREVSQQHQRQRLPAAGSKNAPEAASEQSGEDEGQQAWQRQTRHCKEQQAYPGAPARQPDGATVVSSLRRFLSIIPAASPPDESPPPQQQRGSVGNRDRALPFQYLQSTSLPSSSAMAAAATTPSPSPAAATPPSPTPPVPPIFALFGALERLSRFSEMVQLCQEHADVLDDFLARLTLQLHRNSCALPLLASGANPARSQSSPPSLATSAAHDDSEFLRWHRIIMFLLRQPSELVKVGAEFFTDAVNSWPLHMLYLTCCFYVMAREHGYDALATALCRGGIFCSGKGLFAALAVSMAQSEEDLIRSTACMYRAAFYTGVLMRKRHQHFETETRLTANGGFTLLVVNIPIITLRRLVARVNEGYDVFASLRDIYKGNETERGSTWLNVNSNNTAVSAGTASTPRRRCGGPLYSPNSSSAHASALLPFARSMPHYPRSVIEVSRVISNRSAVLCGHPLDMLRLDMILARFADFNDVKIHKEYLPAGGPENSYFFNKHMAHELMGLWKARGVSFSLASVHLPVHSPVNGDLWAASLRVPFSPPAPPDMSAATMASAYASNAILSSVAPPSTAGYRDEWWMFNVAEAATCSNQDLTYSLRHMQDGSVLLDFSTHAMRIGRLIAWTNKSITVLAAPENRHESSAMPPPRRSPKDEAVRNTMKKLAIINNVLREVGDRTEQPPDALANPSVELSTTFTELGLLEVLQGPRERAGTCRFGAPTRAASVVPSERQSGHHGHGITRLGNVPSGAGVASEAPSACRLDAANSLGGPRGVASSNGKAAGRRLKPSIGALVSLKRASANSANASIPATASNLNNPNAISYRHKDSLSLSSAGAVAGCLGGELWHTISPVGQSDASSDQRTPTVMSMSIGALASLQPKTEEASVVGGASLSAPPAPFFVPQETYLRPSAVSAGRGRNGAVVVSDSLHEGPASGFALPSDVVARLVSEPERIPAHRVRSAPSGQNSPHIEAPGNTASRRTRGIQREAPVEGDHSNTERVSAVAFDDNSADVCRVSGDTPTHAAECFPASMYENGFVIRRNNDYAGIVNVYQVSALITYYEMQFNSVLCDGAVLFARLLKRASGIAFPSYTLLLCPTVFSLLELWDGYEFEELWRRSLSAPVCSRATSPISAGLM